MHSALAGIPRVEDDPVFIAIRNDTRLRGERRMAWLMETFPGLSAHVETGGCIRIADRLCSVTASDAFERAAPEVGDLVLLGYAWDERVHVVRLSKRHARGEMPLCTATRWPFEWSFEPVASVTFGKGAIEGVIEVH